MSIQHGLSLQLLGEFPGSGSPSAFMVRWPKHKDTIKMKDLGRRQTQRSFSPESCWVRPRHIRNLGSKRFPIGLPPPWHPSRNCTISLLKVKLRVVVHNEIVYPENKCIASWEDFVSWLFVEWACILCGEYIGKSFRIGLDVSLYHTLVSGYPVKRYYRIPKMDSYRSFCPPLVVKTSWPFLASSFKDIFVATITCKLGFLSRTS